MDSPERSPDDHCLAHLEAGDLLAVVDRAVDGVIVVDEDGRIDTVTASLASSLGYERERLAGEPPVSVLAEDFRESPGFDVGTVEEARQVVTSAGRDDLVVPFQTAAGEVTPKSISTVGADGTVVCLVTGASERVEREQELVEYRDLIDGIGDPVYVFGEDGRIERVNDAMVEYTGYGRDALLGRDIAELLPGTEYDHVDQQIQELIQTDQLESNRFELTLVTSGGEMIRSEAKFALMTDEQGYHTGTVGTLRDISEQTKRKQELELLKEVLTRVFRHNVRNELTAVRSRAELIEKQGTDHLEVHADAILKASQRLLDHSKKARLIERIVDTDHLHRTDLARKVSDVVETAKSAYPSATIDTDLPETTPVQAHPEIERAIEELLDNAIRHSSEDETPTVKLWTERRDRFVTLFVEDESGGLAEGEIEVLRDGTESDLDHGSGVGLWLIRWLVKHSGADLIAHQTEQGTMMGIRFARPDSERSERDTSDVFAKVPEHVAAEAVPERIHGEPLVGRIDDIHALEKTYDDLERSGGHALFITGETGIGKTTLVEAFQSRLADYEQTPLLATGRCRPGLSPPYHVVQEVTEQLPVKTEAADLLADIAEFSGDDDPELIEGRQQTLFLNVAKQLRDLARNHPVVVVLEDLHWADQSTIEMLSFLVEEVGRWATPIMFVGTYNTEQVDKEHAVQPLVDEITQTGRGTQLSLESLNSVDIQQFLSYTLDTEPVPDSFVESVRERTGGNPLFVSEISQQLVSTVGTDTTPAELPASIEELSLPRTVESAVSGRIEALNRPARSVLELGAVIGEQVELELLGTATELGAEKLEAEIDSLIQQHILEREDEMVAFVHSIVRDETLDAIHEDRLTTVHARVATAIEDVYAGTLEDHYGRLATHYQHADQQSAAQEYYRLAAKRAVDTYRHGTAIEHYREILALARDANDRQSVLRAGFRLAELSLTTDEYEQASWYVQFIRGRLDEDDIEKRQRAARVAARIATERSKYDRADDEIQRGLELEEKSSEELCRLHGVAAEAHRNRGKYEAARENAERQLELATSLELPALRAEALRHIGRVEFRQDEYSAASETFQKCQAIAEELGDRAIEAASFHDRGLVAYDESRYDDAQRQFERAIEIRKEIGDRHGRARSVHNLGMIAHNRGNKEQASEYYERAREIEKELGDRHGEGQSTHNLGLVAQSRGNYERALSCFEESLAIDRELDDRQGKAISQLNLGSLAVDQGRYEEANEHLERAIEIQRDIDDTETEASSLVSFARVARLQGANDEAREYAEHALEIATEINNPIETSEALVELGWNAYALGDNELASQRFSSALQEIQDSELPNEKAECLQGLAAIRRRNQNFEGAETALSEAEELTDDVHTLTKTRVLLERGRLAFARANLDDATECTKQARSSFDSIGATHQVGRCEFLLGKIATAKQSPATAAERYEAARERFNSVGASHETLQTLESLVELGERQGWSDRTNRWCQEGKKVAGNNSKVSADWFREKLDTYENSDQTD